MKKLKLIPILFLAVFNSHAQQQTASKQEINTIIKKYAASVIQKDSTAFYDLFNTDNVTWCGAVTDRSQKKAAEKKGYKRSRSGYFSGTYKDFFRGLYKYQSTEDKFDNITIIEDGTVASVTMDYSFWADNKMTNWGGKYLTLIKRDGKWKITSVIYSLDLIEYFEQPALKERQKQKNK